MRVTTIFVISVKLEFNGLTDAPTQLVLTNHNLLSLPWSLTQSANSFLFAWVN